MEQVIQTTRQKHFASGKSHDLSDLFPVHRVIAMVTAMLACGLGIHRAVRPLNERVGQQFHAFRAEMDGSTRDRLHVMGFDLCRLALGSLVPITAVNRDEQRQRLDVLAKFGVQIHTQVYCISYARSRLARRLFGFARSSSCTAESSCSTSGYL